MKKILIVDDEEAIISMYSEVLSDTYQVLTAKSGDEAIQIARKEKPDLIYLDIIMPKLNGLDVIKLLKTMPETAQIPVALLTNLPKESSAEKATALGAKGYFVKVENDPLKIAEVTKDLIGE